MTIPDAQPGDLPSTFVIEVGQGQMEYFVTFCDNRPTPSRQTRLYMDCDFRIEPGQTHPVSASLADHSHPLARLSALTNLTVENCGLSAANELVIALDDATVFTLLNQPARDDPGSYAQWRMTRWHDS